MKTVLLGDICEFQNGYAFESKYFSQTGGMPLIRIRDIKSGLKTETRYKGTFKNEFVVKEGDYLIGMDGEFRCYEWRGEDALLNQRVCRLRGYKTDIYPRFLFYGVNKYLEEIEENTAFTTVKHISIKQIRNIEFPLPPIQEQKRIVKKLDEVFEKIDKAIELTQKNLQNSLELFESELNKTFNDLKEKHGQTEIQNIANTSAGGTPLKSKKEYYEKGSIPWLLSGEVNNKKILVTKHKITHTGLKKSSAKLFPPDTVVVAMYGATAGEVGILGIESATNQAVCGILPSKQHISQYVYYSFLWAKTDLVKKAVGGAQPNISQIKIKKTQIPFPNIETQKKVVGELDKLSNQTQKLQKLYQQKLYNLEELKQSLLKKAFEGKL